MTNSVSINKKKENKRKLILDTAFSLFMKKGYAKVKVIDIAEGAGIGKGTVYEYFSSKDDILMELVLNYVKKEFVELGGKVENLDTFEKKLKALINFEFDFLKRYGPHAAEFTQYISAEAKEGFSKELSTAINELVTIEYTNYVKAIEFGMSTGALAPVDIPLAVHFISTTITSFVILSGMDPACVPFDQEISKAYIRPYSPDELYDTIMHGIGPRN